MTGGRDIEFRAVSLQLGGVKVLDGIDFSLKAGEVLTILGPSGCGKSTLLRLVAGLLKPDLGEVLVDNAVPKIGQDSAIVFQNFRLLPWKTVADNLAYVLSDLPKVEQCARIATCLEAVGLTRFAQHYPRQLSGGMQQRVALARALARQPQILLMDEPFASLDAQSRELMQDQTLQLMQGETKCSVIFVTHSVDEALLLGDRVLLLSPRPARVREIIDVPFSGPAEARRADPNYPVLREKLWQSLRDMVLSDPLSDFYGRRGARLESEL